MAYCRKCGKLLPDNANHCTVCGAPANPQPKKYDTGRIPRVGVPSQGYMEEPRIGRPAEPRQPQYPQQPQYRPQQAPQPSREPPRKKKSGALIAMYILLGVLIAALLGVGGYFLWDHLREEDPNLGRYEVVSCVVDGQEAETDGEYVELKAKGKAVLRLEETLDGTWTLDDSDLTITAEDREYTGTLSGSTLTLEVEEKLYTFEKEQPEEDSEEPSPSRQPTETNPPRNQDRTWWEGDWYGFWTVLEGQGEMYLMERAAWDVCAQITLNEDGTGKLHIWDEQQGTDQAVWFADVSFTEGSDERGILVADSGTFLNSQLDSSSLTGDPTAMPYAGFTDLLCITGTYTDPENPGNACTYCLILRPWGAQWEDIRTGDMTGMPYPDMLPIHYDSWYLPRIREGAEMPAAFNFD